MNEQPNYYMVITANVWSSDKLSDSEKLLYGHITTLQQKDGVCYASNSYFAKVLNKHKDTISRSISKLKKLGFIKIRIIYKSGTKEIEKRMIMLSRIDENVNRGIDENVNRGIDENVKGNNTRY